MKFSGLLGVKIPVQEYGYSKGWIKKMIGYSRVWSDFFYESSHSTEKLSFVLNTQGGVPIILSQELYGGNRNFQRPTLSFLGTLALKIRTKDIQKHYLKLKIDQESFVSKLSYTYFDKACYWLSDSEANFYQIVEDDAPEGLYGVIINVDDIHRAKTFFSSLGFTDIRHSSSGYYKDLTALGMTDNTPAKRLILRNKNQNSLSAFIGPTEIDLVQMLDNKKRNILPKYTLYLSATEAYKRSENFTPQFRVVDNKNFLAIFSPVDYKLVKIRAVELRKLRFKRIGELDLTQNNHSQIPKSKLEFIVNNVAEKLE